MSKRKVRHRERRSLVDFLASRIMRGEEFIPGQHVSFSSRLGDEGPGSWTFFEHMKIDEQAIAAAKAEAEYAEKRWA